MRAVKKLEIVMVIMLSVLVAVLIALSLSCVAITVLDFLKDRRESPKGNGRQTFGHNHASIL